MGLLAMSCFSTPLPASAISQKLVSPCRIQRIMCLRLVCQFGDNFRAYAIQNSASKLTVVLRARKNVKLKSNKAPPENSNGLTEKSGSRSDVVLDQGDNAASFSEKPSSNNSLGTSSRNTVLKACTLTSGFIAALGIIIRQVSHVASTEGWPILDCSTKVSFQFQIWHLELIFGLVVLISSCRYVLLKTWPDFATSSEAANQQVLSSLEPFDYILVAFLPGISEELLFRGVLLPLFGVDWKSALGVAALFGILHLGSGRKYSFAVWATFVGFAYGYAAILSSSIVVPMASHALNNLVGGILWRYWSKLSK